MGMTWLLEHSILSHIVYWDKSIFIRNKFIFIFNDLGDGNCTLILIQEWHNLKLPIFQEITFNV